MARKSKLGRIDGVPMVAFRVSQAERDAITADADRGGLSVNELARKRVLAPYSEGPRATNEREVRVIYDDEIR